MDWFGNIDQRVVGERVRKELLLGGIDRAKKLRAMVEYGSLTPSRRDTATQATALFDDMNGNLWDN
jgi:hypothetical protein